MKQLSRTIAWILTVFLIAGSFQAPVSAGMTSGDGEASAAAIQSGETEEASAEESVLSQGAEMMEEDARFDAAGMSEDPTGTDSQSDSLPDDLRFPENEGSAEIIPEDGNDPVDSSDVPEDLSRGENEQAEDQYDFLEIDNEVSMDGTDTEAAEVNDTSDSEDTVEEEYPAAGENAGMWEDENDGSAGDGNYETSEEYSVEDNSEETRIDPSAGSAETETAAEDNDAGNAETEAVVEDDDAENAETEAVVEDPAAGSMETEAVLEESEAGSAKIEEAVEDADAANKENGSGENAALTGDPVTETVTDEEILNEDKVEPCNSVSGHFYYEEEDGNIHILGRVPDVYYDENGNVDHEDNLSVYQLTIPASIDGKPVTYIGGFDDCENLQSVSLPEGLEEIGRYAFSGCRSLTQITLPSTLKGVCSGAFQYTGLTSVTIPAGAETIGYVADNSALPGVFNACDSLSSIIFEEGMTDIAQGWCWGCSGLKTIQFPSTVKSIGFRAFADCESLTEVVIPDGVETIYYYAFENCANLEKVTFPASLKMVEHGAFMNTGLTSVTIPAGVKTHDFSGLNPFYTGVFEDCSKLKSIAFEEGTEEVSNGWCANCPGLETIVFPSSLKSIGDRAFLNCDNLTSVAFPEGLETIAGMAFSECDALTEVNLPSSLILLGIEAFSCCTNLTSVNIPKDMKTADLCGASPAYRGPFYNCANLKNVVFEPGIEEIPAGLFYSRAGIETIEIPDSVKSIAYCAFCYCDQLTTIHWGKGVTSIGEEAFYGCTALTSLELPSSLTFIDRDAFAYCENLASVRIPKNMETYGLCGVNIYYRGPFYMCEKLTDVVFEEGITMIPRGLFYYDTGITSITLPDSVTEIGYRAFAGCGNLTSVSAGENLESIGKESFWQCTQLNAVHVPEQLKTVCRGAFSECDALTDVYYGGTKEGWGKTDFEDENDPLLNATLHPEKVQPTAPVKYTITFNANGGTIKSGSKTVKTMSRSVEKGKTYGTLPTAARSGYYLAGWYTAKTGGSKVTAATKASKKTTVYARWVKGGRITYKLNGGTNNSANPGTYKASIGITLKDPTRKGYAFTGWFSDSAFKKKITGFKKGTSGNKTVYAKWTAKTYYIIFDSNGGTGFMPGIKTQYNKSVQLSGNLFSRKNYTFQGWAISKTAKKADYKNKATVKNLSTGKNVTLYAVWKINTYTINFFDSIPEASDGNHFTGGGMYSISCTVGKTYTLPLEYSHTGYTFTGWSTKSGGKIVYKNKASVKNLSTKNGAVIELYANWKANTYTVKFNGNGGKASKAMADLSCTFGKKAALPANTFKLTGYKFMGWALKADGDVKYKNKASISSLTSKNKGTVTLYAQWGYTVAYDGNGAKKGTVPSTAMLKGHKNVISASKYSNPGFRFVNWNTKKDGTGTDYHPGQTADITPGSDGKAVLYAKWAIGITPRKSDPFVNRDTDEFKNGCYGWAQNQLWVGIPNCTIYALGRIKEILDSYNLPFEYEKLKKPDGSGQYGDAGEWFDNAKTNGLPCSDDRWAPKPGAILVSTGHVSVVEEVLDENNDNVPDAVVVTESSFGGIWYNGKEEKYEWKDRGLYNYYGGVTNNWGSAKLPIAFFDNLNEKFIGYIYFLD